LDQLIESYGLAVIETKVSVQTSKFHVQTSPYDLAHEIHTLSGLWRFLCHSHAILDALAGTSSSGGVSGGFVGGATVPGQMRRQQYGVLGATSGTSWQRNLASLTFGV
jgi:hypothetical protein